MSGTTSGGQIAKAKLLARDPDWYKRIGQLGGQKSTTGGFYANRELARVAGKKGGKNGKPYSIMNKTHCPQGHELSEDNTYQYKYSNGNMYRRCRQCAIDRALIYRANKLAKAGK